MNNKYEEAIKKIDSHLKSTGWSHDYVQSVVDSVLHPPQEFEDVEVVRLMCNKCLRVQGEGFNPVIEVCCCHETGQPLDEWTYTELKGHIRRPVPQKVERSVSVKAEIASNGGLADWEHKSKSFSEPPYSVLGKFPQCHSKRGVLTFTWTE